MKQLLVAAVLTLAALGEKAAADELSTNQRDYALIQGDAADFGIYMNLGGSHNDCVHICLKGLPGEADIVKNPRDLEVKEVCGVVHASASLKAGDYVFVAVIGGRDHDMLYVYPVDVEHRLKVLPLSDIMTEMRQGDNHASVRVSKNGMGHVVVTWNYGGKSERFLFDAKTGKRI